MRTRALGWLVVAGLVLGAVAGPTVGGATAAEPLTGAIWTSLADGSSVNANRYDLKSDVYLNGGPQNCNDGGLPDGLYYFQVTDPSGATLLSSDAISARQVEVVDGVIAGVGPTGTHDEGENGDCGSVPVQLFPYDDTPNPGGEYSLDLAPAAEVALCPGFDGGASTTLNFVKDCSVSQKNDNFKVGDAPPSDPPSDPPSLPPSIPPSIPPSVEPSVPPSVEPSVPSNEATISITKFLDVDGNAATTDDLIEGQGWTFAITVDGGTASTNSVATNGNGEADFDVTLTGDITTVSMAEAGQEGFDILRANCAEKIGEQLGELFGDLVGTTLTIDIEADTNYDCVFVNTGGEVQAETGTPTVTSGTTPPPTDTIRSTSQSSDGPRLLLLLIAGLIATLLVITPGPAARRRR
ncbi:MAG: hypothetical protein H0U52_18200 [Chloroflexi bacterium]|nr:hypothetical protein [Chloroflexota bacterium]